MVYIRSTLYFIITLTITTIFLPLMLVSIVLPFSVRYFIAALWSRLALWNLKIICGLSHEITGQENIPTDRNAIVLCKHQSAWETVAVQIMFPMHTFLLKKELLRLPIWGWALAMLEPIAIDRNNKRAALKSLITQGTKCLNKGLWLIVYPEGTRMAPGTKGRFNSGGSFLAHKTGTPIIPVAHNAGEFWPPRSFLKYPGIITVKIGPLIESTNGKASELNAEAEAWIDKAMQEISDSEFRGMPSN
jgi:1-acyl-sn-glycerol-3-phosphate acyltransferase